MRNKALAFLLGSLILILPLAASCGAPADGITYSARSTPAPVTGWQVGNLAPEFNLIDLDAKGVSLRDFAGKPVLINFFATWCPPCREEMPYLQQVYDKWSPKGLVLLEINIGESAATVRDFLSANNLSLPVLLDLTGRAARDYAIDPIPATFFIDSSGVIRQKVVGAFPNLKTLENELAKIMPQ